MKTQTLCVIALVLFIISPFASGAVVMNFTSGTVTSREPRAGGGPGAYYPYGAYQYIESGVTIDAVYGCFFLANGGLNLALESGPVTFSMGGTPFDLASIDASWLGSGDPNIGPYTFTSSKGGSVNVSVNGTYTFPNTSQWKGITSFQWTPHIFGIIDNVTVNRVPEPSMYALLLSGIVPLYFAFKKNNTRTNDPTGEGV
jgi:hypothetical protein